jgi:hypothetical protein
MSYFPFTKLENKRVEFFLTGGIGSSGSEENVGKVCRGVNMVQMLCTHVCKWKKRYLLQEFQGWCVGGR